MLGICEVQFYNVVSSAKGSTYSIGYVEYSSAIQRFAVARWLFKAFLEIAGDLT